MKIEHEAASVNTVSSSVNSFVSNVSTQNEPVLNADSQLHVTRLVREGIATAKAGNLPVAREILLTAIGIDKKHETALMWLASISDKPHQLLDYLQRVLVINPGNERAAQWATATKSLLAKSYIQQGAASHKEGMPEIAAQYFLQATEYEPSNEMAWLWLVSVAYEPEDKLSYLNRVLSLNPTHEKALALFHRTKTQIARSLLKKGNAAAVSGDRETARDILRDVMEYNANLEEAWLLKAFLSDSDSEKILCFEKALEINPESNQAQTGLESFQARTEDSTETPNLEDEDENLSDEAPAQKLNADEAETNHEPAAREEALPTYSTEAPAIETVNNSEESFVEDDTVAPQFVADHYVAVESVSEESLEEELAQEQISAVADDFRNYPTDFSNTLASTAKQDLNLNQDSSEQLLETADEPETQEQIQAQIDPEIRAEIKADAQEEIFQEAAPTGELVTEFDAQTETELDLEIESEAVSTQVSEEAILETTPDDAAAAQVAPEQAPETMIECQFCHAFTKESVSRCQSCGAFARLEKFDSLLANELNDEGRMRGFIEKWQTEAAGHALSAQEYFNLGLGYLNLHNVKKAVTNFEQVLELSNTNDRKWNSEIVAFLAYVNEKMPEILGNTPPGSGKTIMVVDDSPTVRKLIVGKLEKHGHRVVAAVDGMDALSKINEIIPDLILLDVTMPRLDGYQLCKMVKANAKTKHVPVVMISGKDGFFDKVRGRMAGSTAYITKPFGPETLLQTVENYCS